MVGRCCCPGIIFVLEIVSILVSKLTFVSFLCHYPSLPADSSKSLNNFHHTCGYALVGLTPLAFMLSPSWVNFPIDLTLGVLFPVHSQLSLNFVITDYVPKVLLCLYNLLLFRTILLVRSSFYSQPILANLT